VKEWGVSIVTEIMAMPAVRVPVVDLRAARYAASEGSSLLPALSSA
jgi:hypothetical protein